VKWEERQAKREKSEPPGASTARVRKMRELKKQQENKGLGDDGAKADDATGGTGETAGNGTKRPKKKSREEDKEQKPKPSSSAGAEAFDRFWTAYPRKVGKQDAVKAWGKLKPDEELVGTILLAIDAQKAGDAWMRDKGQYIPHPATWLNGGRWLDEVRQYEPPTIKLPAGWWETKSGLEAAGKMLTPPLEPRPGEYPRDFAQRIREALQLADAPDAGNGVMAAPPVVAPYVPPLPAAGVELSAEQRKARMAELKANTGIKTAKQLQEEQQDGG
jgi:hypothetical protein